MVYGTKINVLLILVVFLSDWSTLLTRAQDDEDEDEEGEDHAVHTTVKLGKITTTSTKSITQTTTARVLTSRGVVQTLALVTGKVSTLSRTTSPAKSKTTESDVAEEDEEEDDVAPKKTSIQNNPVKSEAPDGDSIPEPPCPAVQCVKNPKYFDANGELIVSISSDIGKLHKACGTKIMLSNKFKSRMSYLEAHKVCCQLGMKLASPFLFESKENQKCFQELYKKNHASELLTQYRTSGMDSGSAVTWCATGVKTYRNSSWESALKTVKTSAESTCVVGLVASASITLQFSPCYMNIPFMCEEIVRFKTPLTIPPKIEKADLLKQSKKDSLCDGPKCGANECSKNRMSSLSFTSNGTFLFPESKVVYREGCGGSFIIDISKKYMIMPGRTECCKYGMRTVNIETVEKMMCLDQLFTGLLRQNYEFITRAADFGCPGKWGWCENLQIPMDPKLWITGEIPGAKNGCSTFQFSVANKTKLGLKSAGCIKDFFWLCENLPNDKGSITLAAAIFKPAAVQTKAQINNIKPKISSKNCNHVCSQVPCNRTSAVSQYLTPQGTLNIGSKGLVITACGIKYILAFRKQDVNLHLRDCCEYGMRAAEIESTQELTCLENKFKEYFKNKQSFMTRGSSLGCAGSWKWCDGKTEVTPALWLPRQPAVDGCAVLEMNPEADKRSGLTAVPTMGCANKLMFICKEYNSATAAR